MGWMVPLQETFVDVLLLGHKEIPVQGGILVNRTEHNRDGTVSR